MIRAEEAIRAVGFFTLLAVSVAAVGLTLLLPSYFYTSFARQDLMSSLRLEEAAQRSEVSGVIREGKKTRAMISEARTYLEAPSGASARIEKLFAAGDGIVIGSFAIGKTGEMTIEGSAATRDDLLAFEDALRASGDFLAVTFPLIDFVRERNIKFAAHMTLTSPYGR